MNKLVVGGIAALGASVIAATPIATSPALLEAQHQAVQLVADVTDSTAAVYGDLFTNTYTNISTLVSEYQANPFPILSAIAANQQGYADQVGTAFESAQTALNTWWETGSRESPPGKDLLAAAQTALKAGDFNTFYENFNKVVLFGIQNTVLPVLNGTIFGTTGIPVTMAQNFTDALSAFLSAGTLVYGAFQSVFAPVSGAAFELSRALDAVSTAASTGDIETALTALVNTPGVVTNAFLNGFDYDGDDGTTNPWAGLLSTKVGCTGRCSSGGPIEQFVVTIPAKIVAAITNETADIDTVETSVTALGEGTDAAEAADAVTTKASKSDVEAADDNATAATTVKETKSNTDKARHPLRDAVKKLSDKLTKPAKSTNDTAAASDSPKGHGKHAKKQAAKQSDKSAA